MGKYEPRFAKKKAVETKENPPAKPRTWSKKDIVYYGVIVVLVLDAAN